MLENVKKKKWRAQEENRKLGHPVLAFEGAGEKNCAYQPTRAPPRYARRRGFASLAFARSAHPHCARPRILEYSDSLLWAGATSQVANVRCKSPQSGQEGEEGERVGYRRAVAFALPWNRAHFCCPGLSWVGGYIAALLGAYSVGRYQ